jgi:aerobic carbon-monoxide dehydrogenase medium subunit
MKPASFEYHVPSTIDEAVELLGQLGDDAKVIAGGQSLVPMLAMRLSVFGHLVDIGRIHELRGVSRRNGSLVVGAATVDVVLEKDTEVAATVPLLAEVTPMIGHFQIRNRGTVGGSLAHADPAAEYPAVAIALEAQMEVASARGTRVVPAADFFEGVWTTTLEPDELLTAVHFPVWSGRCGFAAEEFARRHGDFAIAGAVAGVELDADGVVARATIAMFGMGPTPVRAASAERELVGSLASAVDRQEVGRLAVSDIEEAPSDLHASASYRSRVAGALVTQAWSRALKEAENS